MQTGMNQIGKRLIGRIDSMYRYLVLSHQFTTVAKLVDAMRRDDRRQLLELVNRRTQATAAPSNQVSAEAWTRLRSDNAQLRMHALANWLGTVYVETRDAEDGDLQELHRRVLKLMRTMREATAAPGSGSGSPRAA